MTPTKQPPPEKDHSDDNDRKGDEGQAQDGQQLQHENIDGVEFRDEGQVQGGQQLPHETAEDRELSTESTARGPVLPEPDNEQGHMPAAPTEQNPQVMFWPAPPNAPLGTMFRLGYASQRSLSDAYYEYPMQTPMPHTAYYPPNMLPLPFPTMNNPGQLYPTQQFQVTDAYHPQYVNAPMVPQNAIPQQFSQQGAYHLQPVNPYIVPPNSSIYRQQFSPPGANYPQHINPQQVPLPGAYRLRHVNPNMVPPNAIPQQFQLRGSYNPNVISWNEVVEMIRRLVVYVPPITIGEERTLQRRVVIRCLSLPTPGMSSRVPSRQLRGPVIRGRRRGAPKNIWDPKRRK